MKNFNPLSIHYNVMVQSVCASLFGYWYNFDVTSNGDSVDTLEKVTQIFNSTGRVKVWSGGSENTIFDSPEINHAFRAWHDFHHITKGLPFTPQGEILVAQEQCKDIVRLYGESTQSEYFMNILKADVIGQTEYLTKHDSYVKDQKGFTEAYLKNPLEAVNSGLFH